MQRSQHDGSFLIVEGDTDARVFNHLVDREKCQVENAYNKEMAVEALDILEQDNFAGVLAIVDADFSRLEGTVPSSPNLLLTDTHDLETMLLQSPALEKVLAEHSSEEKIKRVTGSAGKDVRLILIDAGSPIGYLRWVSLKDNLSLKFEGLSFAKFLDSKSLAVDKSALIKTVKNTSQKPALVEREIKNKMDGLKSDAHDAWDVCCGHDLIEILSIGLCKLLGTNNASDVKPERLEKDLRLAYERAHFWRAQLHAAIQEWERANQPFKVLPTVI
ncbi:DUF4435 domain-containing protein [Kamptonema formosum]|uniref:DUF4435 domain-containing protein n=1 Tax=Kamptonema formosum TaxID=331992 RepID=UPI001E3E41DA|nr:DUF4435 domain-containing protein [Oscillatoria sp. PCC 10802]